jgi:hydroxymethylglutaryl-CoA synthase
MAVEAGRACLTGSSASQIAKLFLATTTSPFADLLCSALTAAALDLPAAVATQDVTGSVRSGTSALVSALEAAAARDERVLCIAADRRSAAPASSRELTTGHAAAALLLAPGPGVARLLGAQSLSINLIDHFREPDREFDYNWEERWVRDEGYMKLVPQLIGRLLASCATKPTDIDHVCMPTINPSIARGVARAAQIRETAVHEGLAAGCGESGAAHPLVTLVHTLENAQPGDKILVIGFGQGGDALLFEVTDELPGYRRTAHGVSRWLQRRLPCSYDRYAVLSGMLKPDRGIRAEVDRPTAMTALYRHRDLTFALTGGRCTLCGTYQIPRSRICRNGDCRGVDTQNPYSFANSNGRIVSWSADRLTYTPDPPAYYGLIDFVEGARLMMDFTEVGAAHLEVGADMRMVFRIKDHDAVRGFTRYFWKAAPVAVEDV